MSHLFNDANKHIASRLHYVSYVFFWIIFFYFVALHTSTTQASQQTTAYLNATTSDLILSLKPDEDWLSEAYPSDLFDPKSMHGMHGLFDPQSHYRYDFSQRRFIKEDLPDGLLASAGSKRQLWNGRFLNWLSLTNIDLLHLKLLGKLYKLEREAPNFQLFEKQSANSELYSPVHNGVKIRVELDQFWFDNSSYRLSVGHTDSAEHTNSVEHSNNEPDLLGELNHLVSLHYFDEQHGRWIDEYSSIKNAIKQLKKESYKLLSDPYPSSPLTSLSLEAISANKNIFTESLSCSAALVVGQTLERLHDDIAAKISSDKSLDCRSDIEGMQSLHPLTLNLNRNDAIAAPYLRLNLIHTLPQWLEHFQYLKVMQTSKKEGYKHEVLSRSLLVPNVDGSNRSFQLASSIRYLGQQDEYVYEDILVSFFVDEDGYLRSDNGDKRLGSTDEDPYLSYCFDPLTYVTRFKTNDRHSGAQLDCDKNSYPFTLNQVGVVDHAAIERISLNARKKSEQLRIGDEIRRLYGKQGAFSDKLNDSRLRLALMSAPPFDSTAKLEDPSFKQFYLDNVSRPKQVYVVSQSGDLYRFDPSNSILDSALESVEKVEVSSSHLSTIYKNAEGYRVRSVGTPFIADIHSFSSGKHQHSSAREWATVLVYPLNYQNAQGDRFSQYRIFDVTGQPKFMSGYSYRNETAINLPAQLIYLMDKGSLSHSTSNSLSRGVWHLVFPQIITGNSLNKAKLLFFSLKDLKLVSETDLAKHSGQITLGQMNAVDMNEDGLSDSIYLGLNDHNNRRWRSRLIEIKFNQHINSKPTTLDQYVLYEGSGAILLPPLLQKLSDRNIGLAYIESALDDRVQHKTYPDFGSRLRDKILGRTIDYQGSRLFSETGIRQFTKLNGRSISTLSSNAYPLLQNWFVALPEGERLLALDRVDSDVLYFLSSYLDSYSYSDFSTYTSRNQGVSPSLRGIRCAGSLVDHYLAFPNLNGFDSSDLSLRERLARTTKTIKGPRLGNAQVMQDLVFDESSVLQTYSLDKREYLQHKRGGVNSKPMIIELGWREL